MATKYASKHGPNLHNTLDAIVARHTFNAGNLWGVSRNWSASMGQLPHDWQNVFYTAVEAGTIGFIVYSYRTPIAWYDTNIGEWVFPDVKYSATTSAHQSVVRRALEPVYISDATAYRAAIGTGA